MAAPLLPVDAVLSIHAQLHQDRDLLDTRKKFVVRDLNMSNSPIENDRVKSYLQPTPGFSCETGYGPAGTIRDLILQAWLY